MLVNWESVIEGLAVHHPDPEVRVTVTVIERPRDVKILFTLHNLLDSTAPRRLEAFEYYFYAGHWPGPDKARLWILAAWTLLMEHEELEMSGADPHHSDACAPHRADLDRRHDIDFMLSRA